VFRVVRQAENCQRRRHRAGGARRVGTFFETLPRERRSNTRCARHCSCSGRGSYGAGPVGQRCGGGRHSRDSADQTLAAARSYQLSEPPVRCAAGHVGVRAVRDVIF